MNTNSSHRSRFIHLYNPKKEGMGSYDLNYINAYKNNNNTNKKQIKTQKRYAA
tara:strand:+ start:1103 stop:1261 length:159 start_codon:yes stop_codon:yes gene_type:complete